MPGWWHGGKWVLTCDLIGEFDGGVQGVQEDTVGLVGWFGSGVGCWWS